MNLTRYLNGLIFVKLKDGSCYSQSRIISIDKTLVTIIDKYGKNVTFDIAEIIKIAEETKNES